MQPYYTEPIFSDTTQQLLPLFAPFRSHIISTANFIEEYLNLLLDDPDLDARPLAEFYSMADELVDNGWWNKPNPEWEILCIHPILAAIAHRSFSIMIEKEQQAVYSNFVRYYTEVLTPKAISPYILSPKASTRSLGLFVMQFEADNLEAAILLAAAEQCLKADLYTCLDYYWLATNQHEKRIRLSTRLLVNYEQSMATTDILPVILFHRANAQKELGKYTDAKQTIQKALSVVPEKDNRRAILRQQLGNIMKDLGQYSEALPHFEAALATYQKVGDEEKMAEMYQNLGVVRSEEKDYEGLISLTKQAISLYKKHGRAHFQAKAYQNLAAGQLKKGQYDQALEAYNAALQLMESYEDQAGIASVSRNIGVVYSELGKLAEAKKWFRRALESYLLNSPPDDLGRAWFDYGSISLKSGELEEALNYYKQAEKTYQSARGKGQALHMMAFILSHYLKKPEASIGVYRSAIAEFEKIPKSNHWAKTRYNLGNILLKLGNEKEAIQCYEAAALWFITEKQSVDETVAYLYHNLTLACYRARETKKGKSYLKHAKESYEALKDEESWAELIEELRSINPIKYL